MHVLTCAPLPRLLFFIHLRLRLKHTMKLHKILIHVPAKVIVILFAQVANCYRHDCAWKDQRCSSSYASLFPGGYTGSIWNSKVWSRRQSYDWLCQTLDQLPQTFIRDVEGEKPDPTFWKKVISGKMIGFVF